MYKFTYELQTVSPYGGVINRGPVTNVDDFIPLLVDRVLEEKASQTIYVAIVTKHYNGKMTRVPDVQKLGLGDQQKLADGNLITVLQTIRQQLEDASK